MTTDQSQPEIRITDVHEFGELKAFEALQKKAWGFQDIDAVPSHLLSVVSNNGGQLLGAYSASNELVALSLALLSYDKKGGERYLISHMTCVDPEFDAVDLGYQIKLAQRSKALEEGIRTIKWTYDPLMTRNGNLNLRKLGARVTEFRENVYGRVKSELYGEVISDRFVVKWDLMSCATLEFPDEVESVVTLLNGEPEVKEEVLHSKASSLILTVPLDHLIMRKSDPERSERWQNVVREVAKTLLDGTYEVTSFRIADEKHLGEYLFQKIGN